LQRSLFDRVLAGATGAIAALTDGDNVATSDPPAPAVPPDDATTSTDVATTTPEDDAVGDSPVARQNPDGPVREPDPVRQAAPATDINERVYFPAESSELTEDARASLNRLSARLNEGGGWSIEIIGHAARADYGSPETHLALSEARARTVRDYLVPRLSVSLESLQLGGAGSTDPIASNQTEEGRALNRRVEIHAHGEGSD
jgi:OOP family OmpA-OmpF porin